MATIDLNELEGDQIVIHYGGALTSVDAYTFANSLVAFADTVRAVNAVINPGQAIEIRLEAVGPGSFRAVIRRIKKGIGGFFSRGAESLFWGILSAVIYEHLIAADPDINVTVGNDQVIIQRGNDRIIVPREAYDQAQNARKNPDVQQNLSRTFEVIEQDDAITNFGLTKQVSDERPLIQINREEFAQLAVPEATETDDGRRARKETARLVILKPWLVSGRRKWSFEWNGVPISAPVTDPGFWQRIEDRRILIGAGDALDVHLEYEQQYDDRLGLYVNDSATFRVVKVVRYLSKDGEQGELLR
jgi:hypothetical protein